MSDPTKRSEAAIAAFNAGHDACHDGDFIWQCPYDDGELKEEWRAGFEYYMDMAWNESIMDERDVEFIRRYD